MRTFLYVRTSRPDQLVENQIIEARKHYDIEDFRIITENISGSIITKKRPAFALLLKKLEPGDRLIVTKLDRLGRDAIDVQKTIAELLDLKIIVRIMDLPNDLVGAEGKLMMQMFCTFAEWERNKISERTLAGLERAKAEGKILGRPIAHETRKRVADCKALGMSQINTAKFIGRSVRLVQKYWNPKENKNNP